MKELFGVPTADILIVLVAVLGIAIATVGYIAVSNRTMFKMGLRNLPRRGLQTVLIVVGLALSTLITTAAFVTGDTVDHSLTADTYRLFGRSDIDITWNGERLFDRDAGAAAEGQLSYVPGSFVEQLEQRFEGDDDIAAFLPFLHERAAVSSPDSGRAVAAVQLTGVDPLRLQRAGGLTLLNGDAADLARLDGDSVFLSGRAASDLGVRAGEVIAIHIDGEVFEFDVAGVVKDELASGMLGMSYSSVPGGVVLRLEDLQALYGLPDGEITSLTVALNGSTQSTVAVGPVVAERIVEYLHSLGAPITATTDGQLVDIEVFAMKSDAIKESEATGNQFTTIFLVLGLFSMAAGIILVFMIFVMLAAERKAEMGMTRAIGAQRSQLVQAFIVEGMAYSLLAGLVGVVAGVIASLALTDGLLKITGGDYFSLIEPKVTPVSLGIGYSLGVVITFVTVLFASLKVSRVNIVSAIRDLPEDTKRAQRRGARWTWITAGLPALVLPPLGLWMIVRKGFDLPWTWLLAPAGLVAGALLMVWGRSSETLFPFALGISLLPLSVASVASYYGLRPRLLWTGVGLLLGAYWLLPPAWHERAFGEFQSDIEMFVISGIMVVVSFTLVIVFNASLLTRLFNGAGRGVIGYAVGGAVGLAAVVAVAGAVLMEGHGNGVGHLLYLFAALLAVAATLSLVSTMVPAAGPALKMGVAYPLANRFRTGMTIAMFSIIVFSLTVFSVLLANTDAAFNGGDARGGIDIVGSGTTPAAIQSLEPALGSGGSPAGDAIEGWGLASLGSAGQAVRDAATNNEPGSYPVLAANEAFFTSLNPRLESLGIGYESADEVLAAIQSGKPLALVDPSVLDGVFNDSYSWPAETPEVTDGRFAPFDLEIVNTATGDSTVVTVVGSLKVGLSSSIAGGLYVNEDTYRAVYGEPAYQRFYLRLAPGADATALAQSLESELATQGISADAVQDLLDAASGQQNAFMRMFQAFMALGLIVGIAGLGVISFRSVVERRQQIGMLRAIGYQRGTVSLTFLLESSFIAAVGIISGVVGGAVLGRNLLTSDAFTGGADIAFTMPWREVLAVVVASFAFSLLMTWWPSRGASRVPVAEALRYE